MNCHFKSPNFECFGESFVLQQYSEEDVNIILSEAGLIPICSKFSDFSICTHHFNFYLKGNTNKKRRKFCEIQFSISNHSPRGKKSRGICHAEVLAIHKHHGLVLPIGSGNLG